MDKCSRAGGAAGQRPMERREEIAMPKYDRATVYFATGTGNSYRVAAWFQEACLAQKIPASLTPVSLAVPKSDIAASSSQLLALAFPTHGILPPWSVIKFLFRMPRRRGTHFFCIPTRGSFFVGPVLVPGAAGLASFLPALVLLFKGFRPRGAVSFDMPMNMTSLLPALTVRHSSRIVARAKRKSERYFKRFFRKGFLWLTPNNLYEFLWILVILRFIPLFPVLYLVVGRFTMGKIMFANLRCVGCGTCAKSCPAGALVLKGRKLKRPYWRYNCEHCLRCLNFCPHHAIEAGLSWAILIWYVAIALAAGDVVYTKLAEFIPWLQPYRNFWTVELVDSLFYYPVFLVGYFLFYHLTRLKPFNFLFSYTGWGRYIRQYREPGTSLKDIMQNDGRRLNVSGADEAGQK